MSTDEITQDQVNNLLEDTGYLQDEAEALQYVIETVDYSQKPPEKRSILELLMYIDHAQKGYYQPVIKDAFTSAHPINLQNYQHYRDTFTCDDDDELPDVQKVLAKIVKHRASLLNLLDNIPLIDWETTIKKGQGSTTIFDLVRSMVEFERSRLKEIADRVMVMSQEKQAMKEIRQKSDQRQNFGDNQD